MAPAAAVVNSPALLMMAVPPAFTGAFTLRLLPMNPRPLTSVTAPPSVVVPVPACWVRAWAVTAAALTSLADTMLKLFRAELPPTAPPSVMLPVPAVSVRSRAVPSPLSVLVNAMLPLPAPVLRLRAPP